MKRKELFLINTLDETLRISVEKYNDDHKKVYLDAVTADGYELNLTLSDKEREDVISLLSE